MSGEHERVVHIIRHVYVMSYRVFVESVTDRLFLQSPVVLLPPSLVRSSYLIWKALCIRGKAPDFNRFVDHAIESFKLVHSSNLPSCL